MRFEAAHYPLVSRRRKLQAPVDAGRREVRECKRSSRLEARAVASRGGSVTPAWRRGPGDRDRHRAAAFVVLSTDRLGGRVRTSQAAMGTPAGTMTCGSLRLDQLTESRAARLGEFSCTTPAGTVGAPH